MKRIVLIDGENLVYGIRNMLSKDDVIAPRSVIEGFNFRGLLEELLSDNLPSEILWFGAKLRMYEESDNLRRKSHNAIKVQPRFVNQIQKQKISFIKVGKLKAKLMNIGYETRPIYLLAKASDITRTITLTLVQKYKTPTN